MSDAAPDSFQTSVRMSRLRVWGMGVVIFVVTFVIGTVLGLAWGSGRLKISWTWSGSDILALASLGGILATAIGTVVLAWKTCTLASGTAEMAEATRTEARAAKDTVTEIQKDRELTFRPYVSWKISGGTRVNGVNLGKGPALNTVFCVVEEGERLWSWYPDLVDFSPGQTITDTDDVGLRPKQGPAPPRPQVGRVVPRKVAFCEDQLGNRYRFLPGSVIADVWRPGENKPDWVMWYEGTAPIAPRT